MLLINWHTCEIYTHQCSSSSSRLSASAIGMYFADSCPCLRPLLFLTYRKAPTRPANAIATIKPTSPHNKPPVLDEDGLSLSAYQMETVSKLPAWSELLHYSLRCRLMQADAAYSVARFSDSLRAIEAVGKLLSISIHTKLLYVLPKSQSGLQTMLLAQVRRRACSCSLCLRMYFSLEFIVAGL